MVSDILAREFAAAKSGRQQAVRLNNQSQITKARNRKNDLGRSFWVWTVELLLRCFGFSRLDLFYALGSTRFLCDLLCMLCSSWLCCTSTGFV